MLVYEYVDKGNLDQWLHRNGDEERDAEKYREGCMKEEGARKIEREVGKKREIQQEITWIRETKWMRGGRGREKERPAQRAVWEWNGGRSSWL